VERSLKIAQIAPLIESVTPRFYGGTERIVSYLTEELVRLGHDVTVFASSDSVTSARLVRCATTALRLDPNVRDPIPYYMLTLDRVRKCADIPTSCTSTLTSFTFYCFGRLVPAL
jgi:Glycosyltransferase Family 4